MGEAGRRWARRTGGGRGGQAVGEAGRRTMSSPKRSSMCAASHCSAVKRHLWSFSMVMTPTPDEESHRRTTLS